MSNRPKPNKGVLDIAPYVGGKSKTKSGIAAVKLSSNETPLGPSPKAIKAYTEAAAYLHCYPDGSAAILREAIGEARKLPPERIVCGAGSDELIGLLVNAYTAPGDEIVISQHGFLMYKIYAQSAGATPVFAPEKDLRTDVDAMLAAVTPRTKIVFIANPNNPTGSYITKSELKRLHDGLPGSVILAIDGAYAEYSSVPDYSCGRELVEGSENVVTLRTFSKIYGLAALRVGWAYAPASIIDVLNRVRSPFNVSSVAQAAGIAAVRDTEFTANAQVFNKEWLGYLSKEIGALGLKVYPSIANFLLVDFKDKAQATAANDFLAERGLIVREVAGYSLPQCLRISVGLEKDNRAVVKALAEFLKA